LQDANFHVSITNDTWKEICSLINGYKYNYYRINAKGNVSHIYQVMKEKDIIPEGIDDFLEEIYNKINEEGIIIVKTVQLQTLDFPDFESLTFDLAKRKYENQ